MNSNVGRFRYIARSIFGVRVRAGRSASIAEYMHAPMVQLECKNPTAEYAAQRKVYHISYITLLISPMALCDVDLFVFSLWIASGARGNTVIEKSRFVYERKKDLCLLRRARARAHRISALDYGLSDEFVVSASQDKVLNSSENL